VAQTAEDLFSILNADDSGEAAPEKKTSKVDSLFSLLKEDPSDKSYAANKPAISERTANLFSALSSNPLPDKHAGHQVDEVFSKSKTAFQSLFPVLPLTAAYFVKETFLNAGPFDLTKDIKQHYLDLGYDLDTTAIGVGKLIGEIAGQIAPSAVFYGLVSEAATVAKIGAQALSKLRKAQTIVEVAERGTIRTILDSVKSEALKLGVSESLYGAARAPNEGDARLENAFKYGMMGAVTGGATAALIGAAKATKSGAVVLAEKIKATAAKQISENRGFTQSFSEKIVDSVVDSTARLDAPSAESVSELFVSATDRLSSAMEDPGKIYRSVSRVLAPVKEDLKALFSGLNTKEIDEVIAAHVKESAEAIKPRMLDKKILDDDVTRVTSAVDKPIEGSQNWVVKNLKKGVGYAKARALPMEEQMSGISIAGEKAASRAVEADFIERKLLGEIATFDDAMILNKYKGQGSQVIRDKADQVRQYGASISDIAKDATEKGKITEYVDTLNRIYKNGVKLNAKNKVVVKSKNGEEFTFGVDITEADAPSYKPQVLKEKTLVKWASNDVYRHGLEKKMVQNGQAEDLSEARDIIRDALLSRSINPNVAKANIAMLKREGVVGAEAIVRDSIDSTAKGYAGAAMEMPMSKRVRRYGSIEKARVYDLPDTENGVDIHFDYIHYTARRNAQIQAWGPNNEILNEMVNSIRMSEGFYDSAHNEKILQYFHDIYSGKINTSKTADFLRNYTTSTSLGPWSTLSNYLQRVINIPARTSLKAYSSAKKLLASNALEASKTAWESGAGVESLMREAQEIGAHNSDSFMRELARLNLKYIAFSAVERNNRILSALAGREFAKDLWNTFIKNSGKPPKKTATVSRLLKELGVDVDLAQKTQVLSNDDLIRAAQTVEKDTQFYSTMMDLPMAFTNGAWAKTATQFVPAAYQQVSFVRKYLVKEAMKGRVMPLMYLAATNQAAGHYVRKSQIKIAEAFGKEPEEEGFIEMVAKDAAHGVGWGIMASYIYSLTQGKSGFLGMVTGAALGKVGEAVEVGVNIAKGRGRAAAKGAAGLIPIGLNPTKVERALLSGDKKEKKKRSNSGVVYGDY